MEFDQAGHKSLDEDDLFDVVSALKPIESKWRELGSALRLRSSTLDSIQATYPGNLQGCLNKVVDEWLKRNYNTAKFGEPSWQKLGEAVRHEAGGNHGRLADEIARKNIRPDSTVIVSDDVNDTVSTNVGINNSSKSSSMPRHYYYFGAPTEMLSFSWFHGQLSREEAEKSLRSVDFSCFLVRESETQRGKLTISLKSEKGKIRHFIIDYGPGWYEIQGTFKQFKSIPELVTFYKTHSLSSDPNLKLHTPCPKYPKEGPQPPHEPYSYISVHQRLAAMPQSIANSSTDEEVSESDIYSEVSEEIRCSGTLSSRSQSLPVDFTFTSGGTQNRLQRHGYRWYGGNASREDVARKLRDTPDGTFVICDSTHAWHGEYILTVRNDGSNRSLRIIYSNGKYGFYEPTTFSSVPELVEFYRQTPLSKDNPRLDITLGDAASQFENAVENEGVEGPVIMKRVKETGTYEDSLVEKLIAINDLLELNTEDYLTTEKKYEQMKKRLDQAEKGVRAQMLLVDMYKDQLKIPDASQSSGLSRENQKKLFQSVKMLGECLTKAKRLLTVKQQAFTEGKEDLRKTGQSISTMRMELMKLQWEKDQHKSKLMNLGWTKERIAQLLKEKAVSESESIYRAFYGSPGEEKPQIMKKSNSLEDYKDLDKPRLNTSPPLPPRHLLKPPSLEKGSHTWFRETDRAKSVEFLKGQKDGTFLCRPASNQSKLEQGEMHTHTVDIVCNGHVKHLKVFQFKNGKYGFHGSFMHATLQDLLSSLEADSLR